MSHVCSAILVANPGASAAYASSFVINMEEIGYSFKFTPHKALSSGSTLVKSTTKQKVNYKFFFREVSSTSIALGFDVSDRRPQRSVIIFARFWLKRCRKNLNLIVTDTLLCRRGLHPSDADATPPNERQVSISGEGFGRRCQSFCP